MIRTIDIVQVDKEKLTELVKGNNIVISVNSWEEFEAIAMCTSDYIRPNTRYHWRDRTEKVAIKVDPDLSRWSYDAIDTFEHRSVGATIVPFQTVQSFKTLNDGDLL